MSRTAAEDRPLLTPPRRLALFALACVSAWLAMLRLSRGDHPFDGTLFLLAASYLLVLAVWRHPLSFDRTRGGEAQYSSSQARLSSLAFPLVLVATALVVGGVLRFYDLSGAPEGIWFDEAQNGLIADRILNDSDYRPLFVTDFESTNRPALPVYVFAGAMQVLGTGVFALRFVSVIAALATIITVFLLGRELFDSKTGAIASLLLAVSTWHLTLSRLAMEPIWGPFFVTAAALFFARAVRRSGYANYIVAGVLLGLSLYFYWACLIAPALFGLYAVHVWWTERSIDARQLLTGGALALAAAVIIYLPIIGYGIANPGEYTARGSEVVITDNKSPVEAVQAVAGNAWDHIQMFNIHGDNNNRHNLPGAPMLDAVTGSWFFLGLLLALSRIRRSSYFLLIAWIVVLAQPAVWSSEGEAPQALRAILVTPAVALLAALPLVALWELGGAARSSAERMLALGWLSGRLASAAAALGVLAVFSYMAYASFDRYFNEQTETAEAWVAHDADAAFVGREVHRLGDGYRFLLANHYSAARLTAAFALLGVEREPRRIVALSDHLPFPAGPPVVVFLDGAREQDVAWLRELYPGATISEHGPFLEFRNSAVYRIIVPATDIAPTTGVHATYSATGRTAIEQEEPQINFDWTARTPLPLPFAASWTGQLRVTEAGLHALELTVPGSASLAFAGEEVSGANGEQTITLSLTPGLYPFEIEASIERAGNVSLTMNGEPVPAERLFAALPSDEGLLATFYDSEDFTALPSSQRRVPLPGFFFLGDIPPTGVSSVEWSGRLRVERGGEYNLQIITSADASVAVDGTEVLSSAGLTAQTVPLDAGAHDLRIRFSNSSEVAPQLYFYWTPPGEDRQLVSRRALSPP